jgi:uncharacterized protein YoxC
MSLRSWLLLPVLKAINQLAKDVQMNQAELLASLSGVGDAMTAVSDQLAKATAEIIAALANSGGTTPEVDAAVAKLQTLSTQLAGLAKSLDDLHPDTPA